MTAAQSPGDLTLVGRPADPADLVRLNLAATRNSAQAPAAYRVFFIVWVDPATLLAEVQLTYDYPGATRTECATNADGFSRTEVFSIPGINLLTDAMLDQPVRADLTLDTCRITATTTLRSILQP
ncbi:MAG: hypothetical protein R3F55_08690 [Alphaproteobacteria bacterium]